MSGIGKIPVRVEAGTGNVLPLLHEIRHALRRLAETGETTTIDLQRLPLAPGEDERIEAFLGRGEVRAEIHALGPTAISETSYPGVWLVTHRNIEERVVARFVEITRVPEVLCSQREDMEQSVTRIEQQLEDAVRPDLDPAPAKA